MPKLLRQPSLFPSFIHTAVVVSTEPLFATTASRDYQARNKHNHGFQGDLGKRQSTSSAAHSSSNRSPSSYLSRPRTLPRITPSLRLLSGLEPSPLRHRHSSPRLRWGPAGLLPLEFKQVRWQSVPVYLLGGWNTNIYCNRITGGLGPERHRIGRRPKPFLDAPECGHGWIRRVHRPWRRPRRWRYAVW